MPTGYKKGPVQLSVLDRLIDAEPERNQELPLTRAQSIKELKATVRRNLEWLLNTRRTIVPVADTLKEVQQSLFVYGLPDISSFYLRSSNDQEILLRSMKQVVSLFEPRLTNVKVVLEPVNDARVIRFGIEGLLRIDPAPEPVFFDTVLEPGCGQYFVKVS